MTDLTIPATGSILNYTGPNQAPSLTGEVPGVILWTGNSQSVAYSPVSRANPGPVEIRSNTTPATIAVPVKTNFPASLTAQTIVLQNAERIKWRVWNDKAGTAGARMLVSLGNAASATNCSFPLEPDQVYESDPDEAGVLVSIISVTSAFGVARVTETV